MKIFIPTLPLLITKYVAQCLQSLKNDNINTLIVAKKPSAIENGDMIAVTQLREAGEGVKVEIL